MRLFIVVSSQYNNNISTVSCYVLFLNIIVLLVQSRMVYDNILIYKLIILLYVLGPWYCPRDHETTSLQLFRSSPRRTIYAFFISTVNVTMTIGTALLYRVYNTMVTMDLSPRIPTYLFAFLLTV